MYQGGMSYAAIAAMYGCGKPAVGLAIERAGGQPRSEASGYMPANLSRDHWYAPAARQLRFLARVRGGKRPLRPVDQTGLDNWLAMMEAENLVVDYDPDHEPNPASPTYGGWFYTPRPEGMDPDRITAYDPV